MVSNRSSGAYKVPVLSARPLECQLFEAPPYQIWLPQSLARSKKLITRRPGDNEVLCKIDAPNAIKAADKRLASLVVYPGNHRTDEIWSESLLVQTRRN